jgi:uncharacterized protein (TIGR02680 family)
VYERLWRASGETVEAHVWDGWRRDVAEYRQALKETHELCRKERESAERVQAKEQELSNAREKRDGLERELREKEEGLRQAVLLTEDALFQWYKGLALLPLSEEAWRTMVHRLHQFPEKSYEAIIAPVKTAWEQVHETLTGERLQKEHSLRETEAERKRLAEELETWRQFREPEPERTEARKRSRIRRQEKGEPGAPLYACCEFREEVDAEARARLETVLHRAGILDAWISPAAIQLADEEEEVWLKPAPVWFGYTLADYLEPAPPVESGLTAQHVEEVLRTIRFGEGDDAGSACVTETGQFVLGPLAGQVAAKPQAEWIGAEARKQARLAEIERLEKAIAAVDEAIEQVKAELRQIAERWSRTKAEAESVPSDEALREARRDVEAAQSRLEHAKQIEADCSEAYKAAMEAWRRQKEALLEKTAQWSRLKKERDFQEALEALQDYEHAGLELKSVMTIAARIHRDTVQLQEEIAVLRERIDDEASRLEAHRAQSAAVQSAVETLRRLVQEMGLYDIHQRIQRLKTRAEALKQMIAGCHRQLSDLKGKEGASRERLERKQEELAAVEERLRVSMQNLKREWELRLLTFEAGHPLYGLAPDSEAAWLRGARLIEKTYRRYETRSMGQLGNTLQEVFALVKNTLLDYSLEQRYDEETGRMLIESLRDRTRPLSPGMLLAELIRLEEEQRVLIDEKDRELYEQILIHSVGRAIKDKINRAEKWVEEMNRFMSERQTSSGLMLSLEWTPRPARNERELDTEKLVRLLRKNPSTLLKEETEQMIEHFRSRIQWAKDDAAEGESLRKWIQELLDYRGWFSFTLYHRKGSQSRRELTDSRFNVLSGGEKAMAMYIPLFAAADSRYKDSGPQAPRLISLDEAFAGVDEENMRDMFQLLTEMRFDYMMTSQILWGCYDTVPSLSIYEIYRPQDVDYVTLIPYYWNGHQRRLVADGDWAAVREVAAAGENITDENIADEDEMDEV